MSPEQQSENQVAEYQAFLDAGQLRMQRCNSCHKFRHPARWICPECLGTEWSWEPLSGDGRVETFVWYFQSFDSRFTELPYNVAVVKLDEGVCVISNVRDADFGKLAAGDEVQMTIIENERQKKLLYFICRPTLRVGSDGSAMNSVTT